MKTSDNLILARNYLAAFWCQGSYCGEDNERCAVGAVALVLGIDPFDAERSEEVQILDSIVGDIIEYNDTHTQREVLSVFDQAIGRAYRLETMAAETRFHTTLSRFL